MIVDRIEGEYAICEEPDGTMKILPVNDLPQGAAEGSVVCRKENQWSIDREAECNRRQEIEKLMQELFEEES